MEYGVWSICITHYVRSMMSCTLVPTTSLRTWIRLLSAWLNFLVVISCGVRCGAFAVVACCGTCLGTGSPRLRYDLTVAGEGSWFSAQEMRLYVRASEFTHLPWFTLLYCARSYLCHFFPDNCARRPHLEHHSMHWVQQYTPTLSAASFKNTDSNFFAPHRGQCR